jgi:hypothetical protein
MVNFQPPDLREQLSAALNVWERFDRDIPGGLPPPNIWDDASEEEEMISPQTELELILPYCDERFTMTCNEFVEMMQEFASARMVNNGEVTTSKRVLVRVRAVSEIAMQLLSYCLPESESQDENDLCAKVIAQHDKIKELENCLPELAPESGKEDRDAHWHYTREVKELLELRRSLDKRARRFCAIEVPLNGDNVKVCLTTGFTMFGLAAIAEGLGNDYEPLFTEYEPFVELQFARIPSQEDTKAIITAYLFELAVSLDAEFKMEARAEYVDREDEELAPMISRFRLRPLMIGKGLGDLANLYSLIISTYEPEFQVLYATKIVEYVSQTVVRMKALEALRMKLLSPSALAPDARFLSELQAIASRNDKITSEDKEAIKQTILACCDATELARRAPQYLKEFHARSFASDSQKHQTALVKFALSLYSTRNAIAHAKANYVPTGHECPPESLSELAACAKIAAQQVVRWFHSTPEDMRIVG